LGCSKCCANRVSSDAIADAILTPTKTRIHRAAFMLAFAASISFGGSFIVVFEELGGVMESVSERFYEGGGA